jgi:hypothetical protein
MRDSDAYSHFPEAVRYHPPQLPRPPKRKRTALRYTLYTVAAILCIGIGVVATANTPTITPSETPGTNSTAATAIAALPPATPAGALTAGIYKVGGADGITPGRYTTVGSEHCYIARLENDSGDTEAIKSNNMLRGPSSVTILNGEFFEIRGTCEFTRAG